MIDIMIDLETMGNKPGSVITSIGAVMFDPDEKVENVEALRRDSFEAHIDISDSLEYDFKVNGSTIVWWLGQSEEARNRLVKGQKAESVLVVKALNKLSGWISSHASSFKNVRVWGNGANFDITLLECYYDKLGLEIPWAYNGVRCYRTLVNSPLYGNAVLAKATIEKKFGNQLVAHDAVDDAIFQALVLQHCKVTG